MSRRRRHTHQAHCETSEGLLPHFNDQYSGTNAIYRMYCGLISTPSGDGLGSTLAMLESRWSHDGHCPGRDMIHLNFMACPPTIYENLGLLGSPIGKSRSAKGCARTSRWPYRPNANGKFSKSSAVAEMVAQCCTSRIFAFERGGTYRSLITPVSYTHLTLPTIYSV